MEGEPRMIAPGETMKIVAPSGVVFNTLELTRRIVPMATYDVVGYKLLPIRLSTGVDSRVYVSCDHQLTDHPDVEWAVGEKLAEVVWENSLLNDNQPCLIGVPDAATPLAQAAAMVSWRGGLPGIRGPIAHRLMRKVRKDHGESRGWVNGKPDHDRHTYWLVENAATSGNSIIQGMERLAEDGYPVDAMPILIFIDREQGAIQRLKQAGFNRIAVAYKLLDIVYALGQLSLWPDCRIKEVEEEIRATQFA